MKFLEVVFFTIDYKTRQGDTCKVANGDFVRAGVLDNLGTQVTALDCSQILLIRFAIACIFV
jgi:hypothetical protein